MHQEGGGQHAKNDAVVAWRDHIAQKMWEDYQAILQERQATNDDSETTSTDNSDVEE